MEQQLKKSISFPQAISIVVGVIIGSGIFLKAGIVLEYAASPILAILAWFLAGIITLTSALTIAEIASAIPKTGGVYTYLKELYGDIWAFLLGWVQSVITYPAAVAALAIAFADFSSILIPLTEQQKILLAIAILIFVVIMNIISTQFGGMIQLFSTIGKLLPLFVVIGIGLWKGSVHDFRLTTSTASSVTGFGAALLSTLWAYDGWIGVTNMAGELENPSKTLPKSIILGVSSVIGIYVLFNMAILNVLPMEKIIASPAPAADVAVSLLGEKGSLFITIGILISVFGALNGYLMTGSRVPLAMAQRGQLPFSVSLKKIHPKLRTPSNALAFEGALALFGILSGSFNTLTDISVFTLWIFFTMGVLGIFILRRRKDIAQSSYQVPLYPLVPLIGAAGGLYVIISTMITSPLKAMISIGITLAGLPIYFYLKK